MGTPSSLLIVAKTEDLPEISSEGKYLNIGYHPTPKREKVRKRETERFRVNQRERELKEHELKGRKGRG
jgi:hypothetical protein